MNAGRTSTGIDPVSVLAADDRDWRAALAAIEAFDRCDFDEALIGRMARRAARSPPGPLSVATPSFQAYVSDELSGCCGQAFPVFSVTGSACALNCDHCQARVLAPMIPVLSPEALESKVREIAGRRRLGGFLLSGGSNRRNEIAYERFYPVIARLKRDVPGLHVAIHSALLDAPRAKAMADAGVDTAMMDVIGADETIRDVYHLDRPVADFAATLDALCASGMAVVPHIVIGLHYGRLLGERVALRMCAERKIDALVLVVVMPQHARGGTFMTPSADAVGDLFLEARGMMPDVPIRLGCARPYGVHRRTVDAYAVMAGIDGVAFPAEGAVTLARAIGRHVVQSHRCCAIRGDAGESRAAT